MRWDVVARLRGIHFGVADEFEDIASGVVEVDAGGAVAVVVDVFLGVSGESIEGGGVDAEGDVRGVLIGAHNGEFALADFEEGPSVVGVEYLGVEGIDVIFGERRDIGRLNGDVIEFEHAHLLRGL